ncbi:MAG: hypothetical protein OER74_11655 [Desulfobacteraceae bacterium]|jgi:hypothetical protein|nr:hypothetical protein [Desulfobacteraceae bacterium]
MVCYFGEVLRFVNPLMYFKNFTLYAFGSETKIPLSGRSACPVKCEAYFSGEVFSTFTQLRFYQDAQEKKAEPIKNPAFIALNSFVI